ncbi:MAG TPA: hypothetical protein ENF91_02070 [Thermoplasmatales archaeon]|nr:hypothetical protein [Thermoplasmatales archaeon]
MNAGSIEEGKKADLICLDMDMPNLAPMHNPISHAVYAASGFNVSSTIIDGRAVMLEREFPYFDKQKIIEEAEKAKEKLVSNDAKQSTN